MKNNTQHSNNTQVGNKAAKAKPGFWAYFAIIMTIIGGVIAPQLKAAEVSAEPSFQVKVIGEGKPVLLIPGLMSDSRIWQHTVSSLKSDYQLHLISLAGFAGTPAIAGEFLPQVQQDLLAYIEQQQLVKPAVIGHSLGAFMAFALASNAPEQIGTVVAVDGLPYIAPIFSRNPATQVADMQAQATAIYQQQIAPIANATLLMNTNSRHFMMLDEPEWFVAQLRLALQE